MNDFNLKKFLTENKLTRNSQLLNENRIMLGGSVADFLNRHKDEVFEEIVQPMIDYYVEEGDITPKELANMSNYIDEAWIDCNTSHASDDRDKVASYAIDFPNAFYYFGISSVPYPGEDEISWGGDEPDEIELLGKKFYLYQTTQP